MGVTKDLKNTNINLRDLHNSNCTKNYFSKTDS